MRCREVQRQRGTAGYGTQPAHRLSLCVPSRPPLHSCPVLLPEHVMMFPVKFDLNIKVNNVHTTTIAARPSSSHSHTPSPSHAPSHPHTSSQTKTTSSSAVKKPTASKSSSSTSAKKTSLSSTVQLDQEDLDDEDCAQDDWSQALIETLLCSGLVVSYIANGTSSCTSRYIFALETESDMTLPHTGRAAQHL